ncbi:uncharacterized protein LOC130053513 [Ostrea edulis]|uniref:uncharacterized protein LOC130053513 n=1 Tax=Ostrea edulis TaxID=37623 RepID=UPI0024AF49F3|nr:uncharacterized protein LOC130053513 [Ostrea edulis]
MYRFQSLQVLSTIPPESIHGIEGTVDTAEFHTHYVSKRPSSDAATLPEEASTSTSITDSPVVVAQTIVAEDNGSLRIEIQPELKTNKMRKQEDSSKAEIFHSRKRRLAIKEQKLPVQESTAQALERQLSTKQEERLPCSLSHNKI